MQVNNKTKHLVMIEKDYNCYTETQRSILKQRIFEETKSKGLAEKMIEMEQFPDEYTRKEST